MKICIWVTQIFSLGGTKRVVTLLANELVKQHDVTIMCYQDRFKEDRTMFHMSEDIKVDFIDNNEFVNRHWTPAFGFRFAVKKLNAKYGIFNRKSCNHLLADAIFPRETQEKWVEYLNAQNYDIIITTASLSLRLGMLSDRLTAKTIGWQHNCYDGYLNTPGVVFWKQECLLQEYLPKLDRYIVLSEYDKRDFMEKLGIDSEVKINPRSFVSEKKCDPCSRHFLMATRFVYAKGLDLMMESFEEFCQQDSEWTLDILGDGELFKKIVADANARGLEKRVRFVGYTNVPEEYYLNSSVFLLPSRWEGWPMVIMEAFEFGLPVIAYHMGAMGLIIDDGKTGLLPEAFDTHKFAGAMLRLAHDEELRITMHKNAIAKSADFAIENAVREWNGLFCRLTGLPVSPAAAGEAGLPKNAAEQISGMERTSGMNQISDSGQTSGTEKEENQIPRAPEAERADVFGKLLSEAEEACRLNLNEELRAKYAEYLETRPLDDRMILYEAFGGRGLTCSPHAIFRHLLQRPEFSDFVHVWVIDDPEDNRRQMERYKGMDHVRFVRHHSLEYRECLATAKYLINNMSFPGYFTKREGQIYINTWHGIPLKTIGFDIPEGNVSSGNSARNLLAADYLISPNAFMTETYRKAFKLEGLYRGTILEEGQPRNDSYFHTDREKFLKKLAETGVSVEPGKKVILYAPTWKGSRYADPDTGLEIYEEIIRLAEANVDTSKYQIFVKPHQIVYYHLKKTAGAARQGKYIPATVDTNELLSVTDVLISDYSSIYFDFLISGKPILFFIPDLDEYQEYRGLYFGVDKLPGPVAKTFEELAVLLGNPEKAMEPFRRKYACEAAWACPKDDGEVCRRVVDAVFGPQFGTAESEEKLPAAGESGQKAVVSVRCRTQDKKKLLLYPGSFDASGRIFSFLELIGHLDYDKYDVTVAAEAARTEEEEQRILSLPKPVRVLYRGQPANGTPREMALDALLVQERKRLDITAENASGGNAAGSSGSASAESPEEGILERCYRRESHRMFGEARFDCAVDLSEGNTLVSRLLSWLPGCAHISFEGRVPDIGRMKELAKLPEILHAKGGDLVVTAEVPADTGRKLRVLPYPDGNVRNYLSMGRLVREKRFDVLLENFAAYTGEHPEAHLYLAGDGPERKKLEQLAVQKELEEKVTFTGYLKCPFGLMKACGAYVKAPGHREDSLSVLEAKVLKIPVYSPDFVCETSPAAGENAGGKEAAARESIPAADWNLYTAGVCRELETAAEAALESESARCRHE